MTAKPDHEGLVTWFEAELQKLKAELTDLETGTVQAGRKIANGDWEDVTPTHSAWLKVRIAELDELIVKYSFPI